jgi:hypothetical protein
VAVAPEAVQLEAGNEEEGKQTPLEGQMEVILAEDPTSTPLILPRPLLRAKVEVGEVVEGLEECSLHQEILLRPHKTAEVAATLAAVLVGDCESLHFHNSRAS